MAALQEGAAHGFEKTLVGQILRATAMTFPTSRSEDSVHCGVLPARDSPPVQQFLTQRATHSQPQPQPQTQNLPEHQPQPQPQHQPQPQPQPQLQPQQQPLHQHQHQHQQRSSQGNYMEAQGRADQAMNRTADRQDAEAAAKPLEAKPSQPNHTPRGLHLPGQPIPERHVASRVVHLATQGPKLELPRTGSSSISTSLPAETSSPGNVGAPAAPAQLPKASEPASPALPPPPASPSATNIANAPRTVEAPGLAASAETEPPTKPASKAASGKADASPSKGASGPPPSGSAGAGAADGAGTKGEGPSWKRLEGWQIDFLERCFLAGELEVDRERREQLAAELKVKPRQVAVWFQNRRGRHNLESRETEVNELRKSLADLQQQYAELKQCHQALATRTHHCSHTPSCPCRMGGLRAASGARSSITVSSTHQQQQPQLLPPAMQQLMVQAGALSDDEEAPVLHKTLSTESSCRRQGSFSMAAQRQQPQRMVAPTPPLAAPAASISTAITAGHPPVTTNSSRVPPAANATLPSAQQMPQGLAAAAASAQAAANSPAAQALSAILAAAAAVANPAQAMPARPQNDSKAKLASTLQLISSFLTQAMTLGTPAAPAPAQGQQQQQPALPPQQQQQQLPQPSKVGEKRPFFEGNQGRPAKILKACDAAPAPPAPPPQHQMTCQPVNSEPAFVPPPCPVHPGSSPIHCEASPVASGATHDSTVEEDENAYLSGATSNGNDSGIPTGDADTLPPPLTIPGMKTFCAPLGTAEDGQQAMSPCFQWLLAGSPTGLSPLGPKPCSRTFPGSSPLAFWPSAPDGARKDVNAWAPSGNATSDKPDPQAQKGMVTEEGTQVGLMDPGYIDQTGACAALWESAL